MYNNRSYSSSYSEPQVDINFFEILFGSSASVVVQYCSYENKEQLDKLRENYPDYFFHRNKNEIYIWPMKKELPNLEGTFGQKTLNTLEHLNTYAKIVQIGIKNFLESKGLELINKDYFSPEFISRKNLVLEIPGIALYQKLILETEILKFDKVTKLGLVINFNITVEFLDNIESLIKRGVDPRDMLIETNDGTFAKIVQVNGSSLNLDNGKSVSSSEVKPVATRENQQHYLSTIGKNDDFQKKIDEENTASSIYTKILKFYQFLLRNKDNIHLLNELKIQDILNFAVSGNANGLRKDSLSRPVHFFGNNQQEKYKYPSRDLPELGTFSSLKKRIKLLVLSSEEYKGTSELFLKKLSGTLKSLFGFENIDFDDQYFDKTKTPVQGFESILYTDERKVTDYDIAIMLISESYKKLPHSQNPYYVIKASLMGDQLPTQEVEIETLTQMNQGNEVFILNNIALAIYGKLGGTPWAIEKIDPLRKEYIIGIGSSKIKTELGETKQIIGFATVFDFTGRYVVGDCSAVTPKENYKNTLEVYLKDLILSLIKRDNIQEGKEIRLIFHLFKPAGKKNEIWAIEEVLKEFSEYKIEFAIVHLNDGHNFRIFANKGDTLPPRGQLIEISYNRKLLSFVSKKLHIQFKGNPVPLLITLDNRSTFKDINYLIKQVFYFSFLSVRSFIPSKTPITILYPSLLANLSGMLKELPNWDYRKLALVKEKLWFI